MERHLDTELSKLNTDLLTMAALTEEAIYKSIQALKGQDKVIAEQVIADDKHVDDIEIKIEEACIDALALFQPMATDLRFITTGMRINMELERIADLAVNICQRTLDIADLPLLKPLEKIPQLADNAQNMVKSAIDAFVRKDETLAKQVIISDEESNNLRNQIVEELINDYMRKDLNAAPRAVALLLIARDLERISDHAASIAEDVIYMINAKIVRHHISDIVNEQNPSK